MAGKKKERSYKEKVEITFSRPKQQSQEEMIRNWLELPSVVIANILFRIGVVDLYENAQKVCTTWHKICKNPALWKIIHIDDRSGSFERQDAILKHAVDRSQGQLVDINIADFATPELLHYVAERSSQLKRLEFVTCCIGMMWMWPRALKNFPMLEELNLYKIGISKEGIETAGKCCPLLKTLKVNQESCLIWHGGSDLTSLMIRNRIAKAIGENLPELRHLELIGNKMTNIGLQSILKGCRHLELLDLRECLYIDLKGELGKKCSENIKCVKLPEDSLEGCKNLNGYGCMTCDYESLRTRLLRSFRNL